MRAVTLKGRCLSDDDSLSQPARFRVIAAELCSSSTPRDASGQRSPATGDQERARATVSCLSAFVKLAAAATHLYGATCVCVGAVCGYN